MEKLVDLVAPRSVRGLIVKASLLVAVFTAFDFVVSRATHSLTSENQFAASVVTFLIGAPFGLFVMCIIRTQRALRDKLRYLSETDLLTGLPNRQAFLAHAASTLENCPHAIIMMIDVDHFKSINDTYGHHFGDICLTRIGSHLREHIRNNDIIGRIGGEEFALLLPNSDKSVADAISGRICQTITVETIREREDTLALDVTMSVGVATARRGQSLTDLMQHADFALYEAKASGRARAVFHDPETHPALTATA